MTDTLLLWVSDYGLVVIFAATLLSCLALPIPASLIMMAGGAFAASDDLPLAGVMLAALSGALAGDGFGFWLARRGGGQRLWQRLERAPQAAGLMRRARDLLTRRGGWAVYLTRWLFSPLGPYVNLLAGASDMGWRRFALADLAGEATWVAVYVSLGYAFAARIEDISGLLGNLIGGLTAAMVAAGLARALWIELKKPRRKGL